MSKIAVILIRGTVNLDYDRKRTLELLRLKRKFSCSVVDDTPVYRGMLEKVKDYVTYGEIEKEDFVKLLEKRGRTIGNKPVDKKVIDELTKKYFEESKIKLRDFQDYNVKPFFRLHPPIKGFERGGIKKSFNNGGALGYRGSKIKDLLNRML